MKIITIFRVIMASLLVLSVQQAHCARTVAEQSAIVAKQAEVAINTGAAVGQDIALATTFAESELIVKKATEIMDNARELLLSASTTQADDVLNVKTLIDQNYAIVMAKQKLEKMRDELAKKVEKDIAPEGYWSKFVDGVKNVGSGIAAMFAAGTGTEEEKETARQVIKGLTEQEVKVTEKYALLQKDLASTEQAQLKKRYEAIVALFEAAIYKQQLITGDVKSSMIKRSLLLGAAAAGTVAAGVMLKSKYFGAEEPEVETSGVRRAFREVLSDEDKERERLEEKYGLKTPKILESGIGKTKEKVGEVVQELGEATKRVLSDEDKERERLVEEYGLKTPKILESGIGKTKEKVGEVVQEFGEATERVLSDEEQERDRLVKLYGPTATKHITEKIDEGKQFVRDFGKAAITPSSQEEGEEEGFVLGEEGYGYLEKQASKVKEKAGEVGQYLKEKGQAAAKKASEFASRKLRESGLITAEEEEIAAPTADEDQESADIEITEEEEKD